MLRKILSSSRKKRLGSRRKDNDADSNQLSQFTTPEPEAISMPAPEPALDPFNIAGSLDPSVLRAIDDYLKELPNHIKEYWASVLDQIANYPGSASNHGEYIRSLSPDNNLLKAGHYTFTMKDDRTFSFELLHNLQIYGDINEHLRQVTEDLNDQKHLKPLSHLFREEFVNHIFDAGSHALPIKNDEGRILYYFYFTISPSHKLIIRQDKYGKIVADMTKEIRNKNGLSRQVDGTIKQRYDHHGSIIRFEPHSFSCNQNRYRTYHFYTANEPSADVFDRFKSAHTFMKGQRQFGVRDLFFGRTSQNKFCAGFTLKLDELSESLQSSIDADLDTPGCLSIDERFQLAGAMLEALLVQAHNRGIIQCNLKPADFTVKKTGTHVAVTLTNFSSARFEHQCDNRDLIPTPFTPPELTDKQSSHRYVSYSADVFSAGLIAALLFGDQEQYKLLTDPGISTNDILKRRKENNWKISFDLFHEMDDPYFTTAIRDELKSLLSEMTSANPSMRPNVKQCMERLRKLYFEYKKSGLSLEERVSYNQAEKAAINLKELMDIYSKELITPVIEKDFIKHFVYYVKQIPENHQSALDHFIRVIGMPCMFDKTNKVDIRRMACIPALFLEELDQLKKVYRSVCEAMNQSFADNGPINKYKLRLVSLISKYGKIIEKMEKTPMNLDELLSARSTCFSHKLKLMTEIEYCRSRLGPSFNIELTTKPIKIETTMIDKSHSLNSYKNSK